MAVIRFTKGNKHSSGHGSCRVPFICRTLHPRSTATNHRCISLTRVQRVIKARGLIG